MMLDDRMRRGEYEWVRNQVAIPLLINQYHCGDYKMDFVAKRKDGRLEFWEAKGYPREYWKGRWPFTLAILKVMYPTATTWLYDSNGRIRPAQVKDARKVNLKMPEL